MTDNGWNQVGTMVDDFEHTGSNSLGPSWSTYHSGFGMSAGGIMPPAQLDKWTSLADGGIIDRIDDALPPKCPHCQRDWHPEPLTAEVVDMLEYHHFRADYNPDADESEIRCVGANYLGPNRHGGPVGYIYGGGALGIQPGAAWVWPQIEFDTSPLVKAQAVIANIFEAMSALLLGAGPPITFSTWLGNLTPKPECAALPDDLKVEFGLQWVQSVAPPFDQIAQAKVAEVPIKEWQQPTFPVPESPGYDFSEYVSETPDYTTIGKGKK